MPSETGVLVTGASSAIGFALLRFLSQNTALRLHAVSRQPAPPDLPERVVWHGSDYSDDALRALQKKLADEAVSLEFLVITNGMLHSDNIGPERALRELALSCMQTVFEVNTFLPMRILAEMAPLLRRAEAPKVVVLSARVGSIGDNGLGGWYSYRGSKAALNMMLRSAAVEFKRLNRQAKLIAFHPGTTDSPLSAPFQARIPDEKIFSPEFVAERLWQVMSACQPDGELSYLDWAGEPIPW